MQRLTPHSNAWYDRLSRMQSGYYYPWKSVVGPGNGEEAYLKLVRQHLHPSAELLDVGCGHGDVALDLAGECGRIVAYDRVASYIDLAQRAARERGIGNVQFICADSKAGGQVRIPAADHSFDLLISRRGPTHWIKDARRVSRPGAVLIQLNPLEAIPAWNEELPAALRWTQPNDAATMRAAIERLLAEAGMRLHSCWTFDVPEVFTEAEQFYLRRTWGRGPDEVPPWGEVKEALQRLFARHAEGEGLVLRHQRFLWKTVVD